MVHCLQPANSLVGGVRQNSIQLRGVHDMQLKVQTVSDYKPYCCVGPQNVKYKNTNTNPGMWSTRTQTRPRNVKYKNTNMTLGTRTWPQKQDPRMCSTRTQTHTLCNPHPPPPPPKDEKKLMGFEPTTHLKVSSLNPKQNPRFYLKTNYFGQQNISI